MIGHPRAVINLATGVMISALRLTSRIARSNSADRASPGAWSGRGLSARHPKAPVWRSAAGNPRILPLVQFCQIRQAIYRQLLSIVLASGREAFNIPANFLP